MKIRKYWLFWFFYRISPYFFLTRSSFVKSGSAPKYKVLNKVNSMALILSGKMMLDYLGEFDAAKRLDKAVAEVVAEKKFVTYDLGGTAGTKEMGQAIIDRIKNS